jgi:hypothetical protein
MDWWNDHRSDFIPARRGRSDWSLSPCSELPVYTPISWIGVGCILTAAIIHWRSVLLGDSPVPLILVGIGVILVVIMDRLAGVVNEVGDLNGLATAILKHPLAEDVSVPDLLRVRQLLESTVAIRGVAAEAGADTDEKVQ